MEIILRQITTIESENLQSFNDQCQSLLSKGWEPLFQMTVNVVHEDNAHFYKFIQQWGKKE